MVFHLDVAQFLERQANVDLAQNIWRSKLAGAGVGEETIGDVSGMDFFRKDREVRRGNPTSTVDISLLFARTMAEEDISIAAWCFLKTISLARHIRTDRLHVAIVAALLDIPCQMWDNSYGKNGAIFRHSLEGRFPSIRFMGDAGVPDAGTSPGGARQR